MHYDVELIAETLVGFIPEGSEFDEVARREARRVIGAAVMGLMPEDFSMADIVGFLSDLTNGYGCWLDWLDDAIAFGVGDLPSEYGEWEKGCIEGSYRMTKRILWELEKHKYGQGEPLRFEERSG